MGTKININVLSSKSINDAIRQLEAYRYSLDYKVEVFVTRLAEVGIPVIEERVSQAGFTVDADGVMSGSNTEHTTRVETSKTANGFTARLILEGEDVTFIEFGAGVEYNGSAGSSPHPKGEEFGFVIGSYGKGYGKRKVWGYYDDGGELVLTRGTKATMPMLMASNQMIADYVRIAREVFGK